jgi:hypothetical protein
VNGAARRCAPASTGEKDLPLDTTAPGADPQLTFRVLELALYRSLGNPPDPELTHAFF